MEGREVMNLGPYYLVDIQTRCWWDGCDRIATHEVFGAWSGSFGAFCRNHADTTARRLKERDIQEMAGRKV